MSGRLHITRFQWRLFLLMASTIILTAVTALFSLTVAGVFFICFLLITIPYGAFFLWLWAWALFGPRRKYLLNAERMNVGEYPRFRVSEKVRASEKERDQ